MPQAVETIRDLRTQIEAARRQGKIDGYGEGVVAGWDMLKSKVRDALETLFLPMADDAQIAAWREAVKRKQAGADLQTDKVP
jgi:hypothetical protein